MFNEIEKRSIHGILDKQNVIDVDAFENTFEHRSTVSVYEEQAFDQEKILLLEKDNMLWLLQSRYNERKALNDWKSQFENKIVDDSIVLVFGFGDGSYIRALMELNAKCQIIVYEPCADMFWHVFGREDVANILGDQRVFLSIEGICEGLYDAALETFINYSNYRLVINANLPNYEYIFQKQYKWSLDKQLYEIKRVIMNRNTEIYFSKEMIHNVMSLSKDIIEQYSIVQLKNIIPSKNMEKMPAVLIAAGPSLDKNIEKLKQIKDSVFIMAVDTALNTVLKYDIIPDMTITVDGHKPLVLFEDERTKNIPIAVSVISNEKVIQKNKAMHFYELAPGEYLSKIYNQLGKEMQGLPTGGSVANNACSLLVLMGFQTIIFMGLDLAYPGGVEHTKDAYHEVRCIDQSKKDYIQIDDIYGNKVFTEVNMHLYLKWFESYIKVMNNVRFIDATEGGAFIQGTEIKTMEQVIDEFSNNVFTKDDIWENIHPYLNKEEQKEAKNMILEIPKQLDEIEEKIDRGIKIYNQIKKINHHKADKIQQIVKLLNEVGEINQLLDAEMVFDLARYYAMEASYEVTGNVLQYDRNDTMQSQIDGLVENGEKLYQGYKKGIAEFRKDLDHLMEGIR